MAVVIALRSRRSAGGVAQQAHHSHPAAGPFPVPAAGAGGGAGAQRQQRPAGAVRGHAHCSTGSNCQHPFLPRGPAHRLQQALHRLCVLAQQRHHRQREQQQQQRSIADSSNSCQLQHSSSIGAGNDPVADLVGRGAAAAAAGQRICSSCRAAQAPALISAELQQQQQHLAAAGRSIWLPVPSHLQQGIQALSTGSSSSTRLSGSQPMPVLLWSSLLQQPMAQQRSNSCT